MSTAVIDFDTRSTTHPATRRTVPTQRQAEASGTSRECAERDRQAPSPRSGVRLTKRGRVVVLLLAVAVAFGGFTLLSDPAVSTAEKHHSNAEQVIVEPGQSLWDIATEIAPGEDPRDVIYEIVDLNGLESSGSIQAGQPLFVPTY